MSSTPQPPYPLHESIINRIDAEYADYYNKHIINQQQAHLQPLSVSRASGGVLLPGASAPQEVASAKDYTFPRAESQGPDLRVRVFTPVGEAPRDGWPVCIYFHGGGWVLGTIDTENVVATHLCNRGRAVVVTVDYRLAPENPFPAAVDDAWEAVLWVTLPSTADLLNINNKTKLAIAGSSCGGGLAAVMCQRTVSRAATGTMPGGYPIRFRLQLLSVPITDNTATPDITNKTYPSWTENQVAPALPAAKMLWFRNHYLPDKKDWADAEASPLLWEGGDDWSKMPPACIVTGELDVLRDEGVAYGKKLEEAGVKADVHVLKGQPHCFLGMDGVLRDGARAVSLFCEALWRIMYDSDCGSLND